MVTALCTETETVQVCYYTLNSSITKKREQSEKKRREDVKRGGVFVTGLPGFNLRSSPHRGPTCVPIHPTLPGPPPHRPSPPAPHCRLRHPSWARCTTERRSLRRRSSFPDPEPSLPRPSLAGCSSERPHCNPSRPQPPLGTRHRQAEAPALRRHGLATRSGVVG